MGTKCECNGDCAFGVPDAERPHVGHRDASGNACECHGLRDDGRDVTNSPWSAAHEANERAYKIVRDKPHCFRCAERVRTLDAMNAAVGVSEGLRLRRGRFVEADEEVTVFSLPPFWARWGRGDVQLRVGRFAISITIDRANEATFDCSNGELTDLATGQALPALLRALSDIDTPGRPHLARWADALEQKPRTD